MSDAVGTQEVPLPSMGVPYEGKLPGGLAKISPLDTVAEKLVTDSKTRREMMNNCLEHCLVLPPGVRHKDLTVGDRMAAYMWIRALTYGKTVDFEYSCNACGKLSMNYLDIENIPCNYMDEAASYPFEYTLPQKGDVLTFRLANGWDEDAYDKIVDDDSKILKAVFLSRITMSVNGKQVDNSTVQTRKIAEIQMLKYITELSPFDREAYRMYVEKVEPGLDLEMVLDCGRKACGGQSRVMFTVDRSFFRPSVKLLGG